MLTGIVSNIQKYSLQDGPGIRTTVFLKGCPLDCWWCHNPEGRRARPEILVQENRCVRCGQCLHACPYANEHAIEVLDLKTPSNCALCGECIDACDAGARQLVGKKMTVAEVMKEILADRIFYEESQGGVSFSGGEPLTQAEFVSALLRECRKKGVHTTLDTCGYARPEVVSEVAATAELILFDLKLLDDELHRKFTGVSNTLILENLKLLCERGCNLWIRLPIIPSVNDDPKQLEEMACFIQSLKVIRQVNLLPYHKTGVAKFRRLGEQYRLQEVVAPSAEAMQFIVELFRQHGLAVKLGG